MNARRMLSALAVLPAILALGGCSKPAPRVEARPVVVSAAFRTDMQIVAVMRIEAFREPSSTLHLAARLTNVSGGQFTRSSNQNFSVAGLAGTPGSDAAGFEPGTPLYPSGEPSGGGGGSFGGNPIPADKSIEQSIVVQLDPSIRTIRVGCTNWFYSIPGARPPDRMGGLQADLAVSDIPVLGQ